MQVIAMHLCENGDEKHVIFLCMGTEHLRHQVNQSFDNISAGDLKVLFCVTVDLFEWILLRPIGRQVGGLYIQTGGDV